VAQVLAEKKPAVLVVWGKNDPVFAQAGAEAFLKDTPGAELHFARHRTLRSGRGMERNCAAHPHVSGKKRPLSDPEVIERQTTRQTFCAASSFRLKTRS